MDFQDVLKSSSKLPVIIQTEVAECGLACLAMISSFHGAEVNLRGLRTKFPISSRGVNLKQLIDIASKQGLNSRPLKLDLDHLQDLQCPAILHWDMCHFVVLQEVKNGKVCIHDPAVGRRVLSLEETSKHFTGVAVEFTPAEEFKPVKLKEKLPLKAFFGKVIGLNKSLLQTILLSILLLIFTLASPMFMQKIIDEVIVSGDTQLLKIIAIAMVFILGFQAVSESLRGLLLSRIGGLFIFQFATNIFNKLVSLPLAYFEKRHIGDIVSRFQSMYEIKRFITQGLTTSIIDGLISCLMLILIVIYSWELAIVVLVAIAIYGVARYLFFQKFRALSENSIVARAKENSNFMETVRSIQSIKLYNGQSERQGVWQNLFGRVVNNDVIIERYQLWFRVLNQVVFGAEKAIILYIGAKLVLEQQLTAGMLIAFMSYRTQLVDRVSSLIENGIEFKMLGLHLDRLGDIALQTEVDEPFVESEDQQEITGQISLHDLSFAYDAQCDAVFKNVSADINAGEHVVIVGPSGCGKSTLMKVMLGLLKPSDGSIQIDGKNLQRLGSKYRTRVATVMQDDQLMSGTIAENIAFFDSKPDLERVAACAHMAAILEDIAKMPMQLNTLVGDMGSSLSGGQKQRILLARALYRKPKVLFMDEATSHLDSAKEYIINQSIKSLPITRIVVAHRIETIRAADRVLMMTEGKLIPISVEDYLSQMKGSDQGLASEASERKISG